MRSSKTVNGVTTTFSYNGSLLMAQVQGSGTSQVKQLFSYDANGDVVSVNYNGTEYFYLRNGQNDVVGLMDGSGNRVVEYTYDAWGKLISTTGTLAISLGADNPFRYRGYYYDTETGLYYLMTRYYDPEVCRFISADVYMTTGQGVLGGNMFAYCLNNPVNRTDLFGNESESILELWLYRWAHRQVQMHIRDHSNNGRELTIERWIMRSDGTRGRVDILDINSGEAWEVKHNNPNNSHLISEALDQLMSYAGSVPQKKNLSGITVVPGSGGFSGTTTQSYCGTEYTISYYSPTSGIVVYDVSAVKVAAVAPAPASVPVTAPKAKKATSNSGVLAGAMGAAIVMAIPCFMGGGTRNSLLYAIK